MLNIINIASAHGAEVSDFFDHSMMGNYGMISVIIEWFLMFLFWALVILGIIALVKFIVENGKNNLKKSVSKTKIKKIYICTECGYEYEEKEWAIKCQEWCKEHQSCNLEIIEHGNLSST